MRKKKMSLFDYSSPALLEILSMLYSTDRPKDFDHHLYEHRSAHYYIQAFASEPRVVYLSVSIPSLTEALRANRLSERMLEDIKRAYSDTADIIKPSREGFSLTLRLDLKRLPPGKKRYDKTISRISSLQAVILTSQVKDVIWNMGAPDCHGWQQPLKLVYHPKEPFFIVRMPEKITTIYPIRFIDDSDVAIASCFFQELVEVGCSTGYAKAPPCRWSAIPPPQLRGESYQILKTNGGFVSIDILPHHIKRSKLERTVWILLNFYTFVKYHVACTKSLLQRKMRQRLDMYTQVIEKAGFGAFEENKKDYDLPSYGRRQQKGVKKKWSLPKSKAIIKVCSSVLRRQIKLLRLHIRIRVLDQLQKRWLRLTKFTSRTEYARLGK